jgi:hypothetical protein
MLRSLLAVALLISGSALATPSQDTRAIPGGVYGNAPAHVDDNDDGRPVIHRPATGPGVSNGVGDLTAGDEDGTVTYSGAARGSLGSRTSPTVVTNEEGRPELRYSN